MTENEVLITIRMLIQSKSNIDLFQQLVFQTKILVLIILNKKRNNARRYNSPLVKITHKISKQKKLFLISKDVFSGIFYKDLPIESWNVILHVI